MSYTKGNYFISHSPVTRDKIGRGFEGFGRWRKSVKNKNSIGGKIISNCFGDTKEEAVSNAKLFASIPTLLTAANDVLELLNKDEEGKLMIRWFSDEEIIKKASILKEAIKKATT